MGEKRTSNLISLLRGGAGTSWHFSFSLSQQSNGIIFQLRDSRLIQLIFPFLMRKSFAPIWRKKISEIHPLLLRFLLSLAIFKAGFHLKALITIPMRQSLKKGVRPTYFKIFGIKYWISHFYGCDKIGQNIGNPPKKFSSCSKIMSTNSQYSYSKKKEIIIENHNFLIVEEGKDVIFFYGLCKIEEIPIFKITKFINRKIN